MKKRKKKISFDLGLESFYKAGFKAGLEYAKKLIAVAIKKTDKIK